MSFKKLLMLFPKSNNVLFYYLFAAVAFKNAKQFEQAKEAYFKEALCHENNKAYLFIISVSALSN